MGNQGQGNVTSSAVDIPILHKGPAAAAHPSQTSLLAVSSPLAFTQPIKLESSCTPTTTYPP